MYVFHSYWMECPTTLLPSIFNVTEHLRFNLCLFQESFVFPIHFLTPSQIFKGIFIFLPILHVLGPKNISCIIIFITYIIYPLVTSK